MILKNKQFEEYSKIVCDKVDIEEGEAIGAKWSEVNLEERLWTIPAERMKK